MRNSFILLELLLFFSASTARAERHAIIIGNNQGRGVDAPLRFAESDADRLAGVLTQLGGFKREHVSVLKSPSADAVESAFVKLASDIERAHDPAALVLFYYSGHADGATLHLGESSLDLLRLKELLAQSKASVRIGILDACGTGALTMREKGVTRVAPFMISAPSELATHGQGIIAAVSASESAQESDTLRGSFFTNYFVSGLRGAADRSGTGRVTLNDAYYYAYAQTVRSTMLSRAGAQHPSFNMNLSGQGDLVLTEPRRGNSRLLFHADNSGEFALFSAGDHLVAQISVDGNSDAMLALDPGEYEVHKRAPSGLRLAKVRLASGEERELRESRMPQVEYVALARKGITPRLVLSVGWAGGLTAVRWTGGSAGNGLGTGIVRLGVGIAARSWVLTPRLTFGFDNWKQDLSNNTKLAVDELLFTWGLAAVHPWEFGRFGLRLGGAVDLGLIGQRVLQSNTALMGTLSGILGLSCRIHGGLGLALDFEPGFRMTHANTTNGTDYSFSLIALFGVSYDL